MSEERQKAENLNFSSYDAIVLAVSHNEFYNLDIDNICKKGAVIFDIKGFWEKNKVTGRL